MSLRTLRAPGAAIAVGVAALVAFATPAAAQSREQRQLMADMRMLQEQNQVLQNTLAVIADAIKAVNARIDEQANATGKAFADQKLVIDNLSNNVREIREKLDDSNVRLGTLNTEVEALRQGLQQLTFRPPEPAVDPDAPPPAAGSEPAAAVPPAAPPPALALGTSPQKLYDEALADYSLSQWDLAIAGFEAVIKYFPRAERAADAQVYIGNAHLLAGDNEKAVAAYDAAIRTYPTAPALPEAYYKKGLALRSLKQADEARAAFEFVVKTYPDSAAAGLARQELARPPRAN
jgi:TolA-binding protein